LQSEERRTSGSLLGVNESSLTQMKSTESSYPGSSMTGYEWCSSYLVYIKVMGFKDWLGNDELSSSSIFGSSGNCQKRRIVTVNVNVGVGMLKFCTEPG
jgi:hypothetical protein